MYYQCEKRHKFTYSVRRQDSGELRFPVKGRKGKIKFQFILSLIGMAIGFVFGLMMGIESGDFGAGLVAGLLYACIGGVFLSAVKAYFSMLWDAIKIIFSSDSSVGVVVGCIFLMIRAAIIGFQCIFATISNTIFYISYLKKTSGFIESDTAALQQMKDGCKQSPGRRFGIADERKQ